MDRRNAVDSWWWINLLKAKSDERRDGDLRGSQIGHGNPPGASEQRSPCYDRRWTTMEQRPPLCDRWWMTLALGERQLDGTMLAAAEPNRVPSDTSEPQIAQSASKPSMGADAASDCYYPGLEFIRQQNSIHKAFQKTKNDSIDPHIIRNRDKKGLEIISFKEPGARLKKKDVSSSSSSSSSSSLSSS
ncbi:hypothetical protein D5F01_LYC24062 [Larimichthys crocea]|uniref:Uncharacterized protein n=1 Tax=Larimichthys crocea TaxID=215358 RepID=A0A6G0HFA8_LARCR|nr:hypothetical protein D5F01_LYC24062 [Larimichthys crocea]